MVPFSIIKILQPGPLLFYKKQPLTEGKYMYVIDTDNNIRYVPIPEGGGRHIVHSELAGSNRVLSAGEFKVNGSGQIKEVNLGSGHFRPPPEHIVYTRAVFLEKGIDIQKTNFKSRPPQSWLERQIDPGQTFKTIKQRLRGR